MFTLDAYFDNTQVQYKSVVENLPSGQFARVRHCSQSPVTEYRTYMDWRFGNRTMGANDPSCFKYPFENETYLRPTQEQEDWWYERLVESSHYAGGEMSQEQLDAAWKNLVNPKKAFTNNRDLDVWGYRINGRQLRMEPVVCTGATVKLIDTPFLWNGQYWQKFEVIDMASDDWRGMTIESHWWLIQAATSSLNTASAEQVNPFPKMQGDRMTPYILWGWGVSEAYLPAGWFEPLPADLAKPAYPYLGTWAVVDLNRFDERTIQ